MNEIKAEAFLEWQRMPLDKPTECEGCGELMLAHGNRFFLFIFNEVIETGTWLCDGCYELLDKKDGDGSNL